MACSPQPGPLPLGVMTLSEIEQFFREQDERMAISDGDSDEDSLAATSIRNVPASHTAPLQKEFSVNVAERTQDHVDLSRLDPTADPAAHQQYRTHPATNHVPHSDSLYPGTGAGPSVLKRKNCQEGTEPDTVRESVEEPKRKHSRNLQPLTIDAPIFPSVHHGIVSPSESRERSNGSSPNEWVRISNNTLSIADPALRSKDDKHPQAPGQSMTKRRAKLDILSGTNISISPARSHPGTTNGKGKAEPERVHRKIPKGANLAPNPSGGARDIVDLTLEFSPQHTSTQVTSNCSRKTRIYPEGKAKVSSHAANSPRRDKVIKPISGAKVSGNKDTMRPLLPFAPQADFPTRIDLSKSTGREEIDVLYSSNVTTPANSNPSGIAASAFPLTSIPDDPSTSRPDSGNGRSKPDPKSKKGIKAGKGKVKEKPVLVTPLEYARRLQESLQAAGQKLNRKCPKYLKGKRIFYAGGDMQYAGERTRKRMDIIVKFGGTLLPTYDASEVTHIVTDAPEKTTLRALGLRKLDEIPSHVPTVKWSWVLSGKASKRAENKAQDTEEEVVEYEMDDVCLHAAFLARFDAGAVQYGKARKDNRKVKPNALASTSSASGEISRISEFTQEPQDRHPDISLIDRSSKSSIITSSPAMIGDSIDPLAEFYAAAKAEAEDAWPTYREEHSDDELSGGEYSAQPSERAPATTSKRGFTCDIKEVQGKRHCVNQDVVDKLQELMELHKAKPSEEDRWRAFSYGKCLKGIRNYPKRITSHAEARSIRGVGDKTALKIMEILQTGELRRIGYEKTEDVEATKIFQGIYGVGPSTAFKWYASGCRTLADIVARKGGIKLSPVQEIGVRFYDDINDRMPRAEAEAIFQCIKPLALAIDPKLFIDIMGSFRRGKADCGDIDILITRRVDDGKNHLGVLRILLRKLHEIGLLTEDLSLPEDWEDLECTYRGLCRLPHQGKRRRRIDILTVPWHSRGAALLYYTGDDIFNRAMRFKAGTMGYSLNQRGLYGGIVRDPRDRKKKLNQGTIVASETEEEIFKILGVPWQEPHERVRG